MTDADESALLESEMAQINTLADEFERAFRAGGSPRIEDYLSRFAEGVRPVALRELLRVEIELRRNRCDAVDINEYLRRFPGLDAPFLDACCQSDVVLASAAADKRGGAAGQTQTRVRPSSKLGSGRLEVRCPNCHAPTEVAVDTVLTDITCRACGSQFSLVNQGSDTQMATPLSTLGRFELIERIGMGAFGSVWKARDKELDRTVAIKIPRRGAMTSDEQEQFFREARAAAQLKHPNIVSVHEVGRDGDSIYIVSDFVRGVTLADWLTGQQLTSREAAQLCAKIAGALHHAHEQGVVHRDLKPANIMMDYDGQPHLMDFGLARREAGEVTMTIDGQVLGTPAYMSPEQAQGEAHQADRRSDVYSVGVILFQLLTGEVPFRGNVRMLIKQVIHDEPPSPRKLNSNVPRDLETITLKCLEKEPARRYQTASELSAEFRRYLAGEPILVRPINRIARAWRWCKRRPAAAALLTLLVIAAAGFAAAFARERDLRREVVAQKNEAELQRADAVKQRAEAESRKAEAEAERAGAEAVVHFLTQDVLAKATPEEIPDKAVRDVLVTTLIEPAADIVGQRFHDKPLIEAKVRGTLVQTLHALGRFDLALVHAQEALELRRKVLGEDHPETITSLNDYAGMLDSVGRVQEAEPLYKRSLEQHRKLLGEDHRETIMALNNYAAALHTLGKMQEAEPLYQQAFDQCRKVLGEKHPNTMMALSNYANVLDSLGRAQDAEPLFKQALDERRSVLGENHPETIASLSRYASVLESLDRAHDAEPLHKQALEQSRKVLGENHPETLRSLNNYAAVLNALDRPQEAEPLYKEALEQRRKLLGEDHPSTITSLNNYAIALHALGRAPESEPLFKQALEQYRKVLGEDHATTILALDNYAGLLKSLGRADEAEPLFKQALEYYRKELGDNHPETIRTLNNYALVLGSLGRVDEAEQLLKPGAAEQRNVGEQ